MTKSAELQKLIQELLDDDAQITIRSVAEKAKLSESDPTARRAIRRAIKKLEDDNVLAAVGAGRSRAYVANEKSLSQPDAAHTILVDPTVAITLSTTDADFARIEITPVSKALLDYVSLPLKTREPAGYRKDFLEAYQPNRTRYLTRERQQKLQQLGQVDYKVQAAGTYAKNIMNRLLIDLSWNSSRLEGNTYTLLETKRLIEFDEAASAKDLSEAQMILNHKAAIEFIIESSGSDEITSLDVRSVHALLSDNLLGDPSATGKLREIIVGISGSTYLPIENPHFLKQEFEAFIQKLNQIENPFEQSLFALVHLSYLQAFEDVNKRTARLVANIPFVKKNLKPLAFNDVAQSEYMKALLGVYEKNDVSLIADFYVWAYTRSAQRYTALQHSMGEPNALKLTFRAFIHETIRDAVVESIPPNEIVSFLQKRIASLGLESAKHQELFTLLETEIANLHEASAARFKIRPSEFLKWKQLQGR